MEMKLREGTRGFSKNSRQDQKNGFETHTRTEKGERKVNHYVMKLEGQKFFFCFALFSSCFFFGCFFLIHNFLKRV